MRALLFAVLLGCAHSPPVTTPVLPTPTGCVREAPPQPNPVAFVTGGACPPAFEACLSREGALRLEAYLRQIRTYANDAWVQCK